jgi:nucleoside-diphosphate-sugar epimerase
MKILIIGGTGFIGKPVTKMFVQNGHEVAVFHHNKETSDTSLNTVELIGNRDKILNYKNEFFSFKPDLVIDITPYTAQDIWGLKMAIKDATENLLLLSSGDVYKVYDTFHKNLSEVDNSPITETSELRSKLYPYKSEKVDKYDELLFNYDKIIVETMAQEKSFNTCILRLPAIFGEGDKQQKLSEYIIPMITNQASIILSVKKANWIWTRSYVENIAYGIYLASTNEKARNNIFNLGDINLKEFDLVTTLKKLTGWEGEIIIKENISEQFNYEQNIIMDSSKIKQVLHYSAPINNEVALLKTIQNYRLQ